MRAAGTAVTVHVAAAVLFAAVKQLKPDLEPASHLSDDTIRRWLSNVVHFSYRAGEALTQTLHDCF